MLYTDKLSHYEFKYVRVQKKKHSIFYDFSFE